MDLLKLAFIALLLILLVFFKKSKAKDLSFSKWDCAELDLDHALKNGRCAICGKNFRRKL